MNNIAEGFDAGGNTGFIRFLKYSQRSASEIMFMTVVLKDIYKITEADILYTEIARREKANKRIY